jgi:hypothetical protein
MEKSSPDPDRRPHQRDKATIDHVVDQVLDPKSGEKHRQSPTTDSGASVEEQVRKEWDPKQGGLPTF